MAWHTLGFGQGAQRVEVSVPQLTPAQLSTLAQHVRGHGGAQIKPMPLAQIIAAIDRAIERLLNPADPYRLELELLLPRITGFDAEMVRLPQDLPCAAAAALCGRGFRQPQAA